VETQKSMWEWSCSVFGNLPAIKVAQRMGLEVAELAVVMEQYGRNPCDETKMLLINEIADVNVMLNNTASAHNTNIEDCHEYFIGLLMDCPSVFEFYSTLSTEQLKTVNFSDWSKSIRMDYIRIKFGIDCERRHEALTRIGALYTGLNSLASALSFSLAQVTADKMQINRARKWKISPEGMGQHVEEAANASS